MNRNIQVIYSTIENILNWIFNNLGILGTILIAIFGWVIKKKLSDRPLMEEIYSKLHTEIYAIQKNILDFEYIRFPNNISVRESLIQDGRYDKIPKKPRKDIDTFYTKLGEYNQLYHSATQKTIELWRKEVGKIKTPTDQKSPAGGCLVHKNFLLTGELSLPITLPDNVGFSLEKNYSGYDTIITKSDLEKNSTTLEKFLTHLLTIANNEKIILELRNKRKDIIKDSNNLLEKIKNRISNPTPLFEFNIK